MADEQQVALIGQGSRAWNEWRQLNPVTWVDLIDANLTDVDLSGANLSGANLTGASLSGNLTGANLIGAVLAGAFMSGANLADADLSSANLSGANLTRAFLSGNLISANLRGAVLAGAFMSGANLTDVDLRGANLSGANLTRASLSGNLTGANLRGAELTHAAMFGANLTDADMSGAELRNVGMSGANLTGANLSDARMHGTFLSAANLGGANLTGAYLFDANLTGARLAGANLAGAHCFDTVLANLDLSQAIGLESISHAGPSVVDHRTLERSGPLPLSFLRGCGLPDRLIDYLPSLLNAAPIEFNSVFISYSTANQDFAERLHADLQARGVRCWFAPHDMAGGKRIHDQIDEAIRIHDRLLLILSRESMSSRWVETEIYKAREKEGRLKRDVLFPVALVPFGDIRDWRQFNADSGEDTARAVRQYFVPDFSNWDTDHSKYLKSFEKLLASLKSADTRSARGGTAEQDDSTDATGEAR